MTELFYIVQRNTHFKDTRVPEKGKKICVAQASSFALFRTLWRWADLKGRLLNIGRVIWVTAQNLYVIPAHCLWMALIWIPITRYGH